MGCCQPKECIKCGCPSEYYIGRKKNNSCQIHAFIGYKCIDCGMRDRDYGNCVHKWV